jgi:hypothetical protein
VIETILKDFEHKILNSILNNKQDFFDFFYLSKNKIEKLINSFDFISKKNYYLIKNHFEKNENKKTNNKNFENFSNFEIYSYFFANIFDCKLVYNENEKQYFLNSTIKKINNNEGATIVKIEIFISDVFLKCFFDTKKGEG